VRTNLKDFLERSYHIHGMKYNYSKVIYLTTESIVIIKCPVHGDFSIRARAHYQDRRGCPQCDSGLKSGFSENSAWALFRIKRFYIIEAFGGGERFLKIGVTTEHISKRLQKGQFPYDYNLLFETTVRGGLVEESRFIKKYSSLKYYPKKKFRGNTECLEFGLKSHILSDAKTYFKK